MHRIEGGLQMAFEISVVKRSGCILPGTMQLFIYGGKQSRLNFILFYFILFFVLLFLRRKRLKLSGPLFGHVGSNRPIRRCQVMDTPCVFHVEREISEII